MTSPESKWGTNRAKIETDMTENKFPSHIAWGTHICLLYQTRVDLIEAVVPYLKTGLENNELCVWVTSNHMKTANMLALLGKEITALDIYIKQSQLEILDMNWCHPMEAIGSEIAQQRWAEKSEQAIKKGYSGIRVVHESTWFVNKELNELTDHERMTHSIMSNHRMIYLCCSPLDRYSASELVKIIENHQFTFIRQNDVWEIMESFEHRTTKQEDQFPNTILEERRLAELMKAQKIESIDILAARIAHDFNNSLAIILSNVFLGRMYKDPEVSRAKLLAVEREIMQAKELTQQLLTLSKDNVPTKEVTAITGILKNSATFASRGSSTRCDFFIPDNIWPVDIDEGQIRQAITNLIINADQAMPQGGIIEVYAENISANAHNSPLEDGNYVKISIKDHGVGISEEDLSKIFDLYFTTKRKGTGLGLATVQMIVRNHGGAINVESHMGIGTTFNIFLPASPDKVPIEKPELADDPVAGAGKILVMDDEEYIRKLASEILSGVGYEVTTARDGAEAIELYQRARDSGEPYHAIIIDLTIPGGIGGQETIQKLKQIDDGVKAIISSGYINDPAMISFQDYGFKGAIPKPYRAVELSMILREVISK